MFAAILTLAVLAITAPASTTNEQVFNVKENTGAGANAAELQITGSNNWFFNNVGPCQDYFTIASKTGVINTKVNIDREQIFSDLKSDNITCTVQYNTVDCSSPCQSTIVIKFHIVDVNDVVPTFVNLVTPVQEIETYQNIAVNQIIKYLQPRDDDVGVNAQVSLHLVSGNDEGYFRIGRLPTDGPSSPNRALFLNKSLGDVSPGSSFNLTIYLEDNGSPPLNSTQYLVIKVKELSESTTSDFLSSNFLFQVDETHPIGIEYPFGQVIVSDDSSANIFYQFINGKVDDEINMKTFEINPLNGMLYLIQPLDYDQGKKEYEVLVEARDPESTYGTHADVEIEVHDANDEYPQVSTGTDLPYNFNVMENQNSVPLIIQFIDNDANETDNSIGDVNISFSSPVKHNISLVVGRSLKLITVNLIEPLDREADLAINMTVNVSDGGQPALSTSTLFNIHVGDENDNAPQFSMAEFEGKVPESTVSGRSVMSVSASDPDEGESSTFDFAITAIDPVEANNWFGINQTSGEIFVASLEGYESALQPVKLTVTATDHGNVTMSNSSEVTISFTPPYSFAPRSFQEYAGYDMFAADTIYLEFRTGKTDALLFFEKSPDASDYTALELVDMKLYYTQSQNSVINVTENDDLVLDVWYSVLINNSNKQSPEISVWKRQDEEGLAFPVLQSATSSNCPESAMEGGPTLYIGGLDNAFTSSADRLTAHDFSGCIATMVVDRTQLDMQCPQNSRNVVPGCVLNPSCPASCTTECVKYGESPGCQCAGGFTANSCSSTSDYGDFSVENGGFVQFTLGYDFFYESVYNNPRAENSTNEVILQSISISIRPAVDDPAGIIFYSSTNYSQLLLLHDTFLYSVYPSIVAEPSIYIVYNAVSLSKGVQYTITLDIMNDTAPRLTLSSNGSSRSLHVKHYENLLGSFPQFASRPETRISLGGKNDEVGSQDKWFAGCMSHFIIDGIEIPVRGMMENGMAEELTVEGTDGHVATFCHGCITGNYVCPLPYTCNMDDLTINNYSCICPDGYTAQNNECVSVVTAQPSSTTTQPSSTTTQPSPTTTQPPSTTITGDPKLQLEIIIGVAVVIIIVIFILFIAFGLACRWAYIRGKKARLPMITQVTDHTTKDNSKETEHIDGSPIGSSMIKNSGRQNAYVLTTLRSSPSVQDDTDNESTTDLHFSPCSLKRKTASNETGFQSASEMEDGRRSFPVASDSGNEPYSSTSETESDYFTNTSGIVRARSPSDMHLVSSGSVMGIPNTSRMKYPLTSQECKTLQVFRPDSAMLSDTDTDISTTINNAGHTFSDNEINTSDPIAPKWYKSSSPSTVVDAEPSLPYGVQAAVLHKHSRHPKRRPPNLKHIKVASPPHTHHTPSYTYYNGHHPPPQSSSPLVHSNRFEFPPAGPASAGLLRGQHFPMFEPEVHHRLPTISESVIPGHYSRGDTYQHSLLQHQQYKDSALYGGEHRYEALPQPVLRSRPEVASTSPYYPGYQGTSLSPAGEFNTPRYRDLNSFPKVNPITYYEQQERMKPIVDQDDSLNFLSEPYVQFEDVSTEPSVIESSVVESTVVDDEKDLHIKNHYVPVRERLNGYKPSPLIKESRMASTLPHSRPKFGHSPTPTEPRIFSPASFNQFSSQGAEEAAADGINSILESVEESPQEIPELSSSSSLLNSPNKTLNHFPSADCTPPINSLSGDTLTGSNHDSSPHANGYHLPISRSVK